MAELLIKAISANHSDPIKNEQGCYKRGDIVDVRPDGFGWGNSEGLPNFVRIGVTGVDASSIKNFMVSHYGMTGIQGVTGLFETRQVVLKRRLWNVLLDDASMPQTIKDSLNSTGRVTVTKDQIQGFVQNKSTSETWK
jgi:hypothetical protein